jgi:L-serine deaminase
MTPAAMHAPSHALSPGVLMDVDCTQTLIPVMQTCYHCGQTSHISREYDLHHDVHHMMLDEQDEFIQHIIANHNMAITSVAESTTHMGTTEGTLVEGEVDDLDFVRSSG